MLSLDPTFALALNIALTVAVIAIGAGSLISLTRPATVLARADRYSMKARLPYGTDAIRASVARGLRARGLAGGAAILAAGVLAVPFLFTALGTDPLFIFYVLVTALVAGGTIATVAVNLRERLFHPAPDAPRVARARRLGVGDYLGAARSLLPWMLFAAAVLAFAVLVAVHAVGATTLDRSAATAAVVFAVTAVASFVALPVLDRLILDSPQPASDTLELAWDDTLRADALGALRLSASIAAWFAFAFAIGTLWTAADASSAYWATQMPTWGMIALQFVYPNNGRALRAPLYPDWLSRPVLAGGAA
ncbi:hypothetical protein JOD63_001559 [Microbacterium terrae]|uniref:Uncharacterized protein n=1 Tax=Microbacterium terrae TaxID=69369 RepID=A0A0M2H9S8_9MICO|nr:hypothetical protein [Microbacterium terrae]KJL41370.1 hypothetical protein RS81_01440 [Microbacterium terrae]MBP1077591.1 hypothetical protein [Microbacterium terrae]GLJ99196.1 hypothetical protein GCM10017594_23930 [Microbacterium terrae]